MEIINPEDMARKNKRKHPKGGNTHFLVLPLRMIASGRVARSSRKAEAIHQLGVQIKYYVPLRVVGLKNSTTSPLTRRSEGG